MEGTIYMGWETQGVAAPRGKPYGGNPWCLGSSDNPYGLGQILTQEVARYPCD
jgi:hypothetical protein